MYLIARCPSCGRHIMANTANKTRTCPHCRHRADLHSLRVLARAESSREAVMLIQRLKEKSQDSPEATFKRFRV